jgi:Right handed beta helix region
MTRIAGLLLLAAFLHPAPTDARTLVADPSAKPDQPAYYRSLVRSLTPGDTLELPAGTYPERLNLDGIQGRPSAWIVITGPSSGEPATITTDSDCCNTVQLGGTAYLALKNLTIDSGGLGAIDGINAKGNPTHDILIEQCTLVGQGADQGTVAINTKSPAWRWTIRGNRIVEAGTGIYLGNSDGSQPFIRGLIEGNLILNSIGYNMEIKHQLPYEGQPWVSELPSGPHRTVIRNNVFIKEKNDWPAGKADAGFRPNLLVDPFPPIGRGSSDLYEIYGNLFFRNPDESLFQGSGRVVVHDNLFVGAGNGQASILLTDHNGLLQVADVYNNTIYSLAGGGIEFRTAPRKECAVVGNLVVTGGRAFGGVISHMIGNVVGDVDHASRYFVRPSEHLGKMDFYPASTCRECFGAALPMVRFKSDGNYDRDFNGRRKTGYTFRGAYAGRGSNPGWLPARELKLGGPGTVTARAPEPPKGALPH